MREVAGTREANEAIATVRAAIAKASDAIRKVGDLDIALTLADVLRERSTSDAIDVRFRLVVDEYVRVERNASRLGESLGRSRQRASAMIKQAEDRGIAVPKK